MSILTSKTLEFAWSSLSLRLKKMDGVERKQARFDSRSHSPTMAAIVGRLYLWKHEHSAACSGRGSGRGSVPLSQIAIRTAESRGAQSASGSCMH